MSRRNRERKKRRVGLRPQTVRPTPADELKMSAVILQVAEPFIREYGTTPDRVKTIISLVIVEWNKSMLPPDEQPAIEEKMLECLLSNDGSAEDLGAAAHMMNLIAERRQQLFPHLRKFIIDYELDCSGGRMNLNVVSSPMPPENPEERRGSTTDSTDEHG
jgi:hypothetical protein